MLGECGFERGEPHTVREFGDASHLRELETSPGLEDGIGGARAGEDGVEHPPERFDAGAAQVGLKLGRFGDRGRLGERDEDQSAERRGPGGA